MQPTSKIFYATIIVCLIIFLAYEGYGICWAMVNTPDLLGLKFVRADIFTSMTENDFKPIAWTTITMLLVFIGTLLRLLDEVIFKKKAA